MSISFLSVYVSVCLWLIKIAEARALVAYLAVEEAGHSAADVARYPRLPTPGTGGQVGIGRTNILRSIKRGLKSE